MLKSAALASALALTAVAAQAAPVHTVVLPGARIFPESITSTKAGELIIGSYGNGGVYRARPGADKATLFIDPAKTGIKAALGVFANEATSTLYVCSISPQEGPSDPANANLYAFNLKTGTLKAKIAMPEPAKAVCNDMDIKAGVLYVTDTGTSSIYTLAPGGKKLETWLTDPKLAGIDGIAFAGDGSLFVNSVTANKLFHIAVGKDGKPGAITELKPSMPITGPDGMRKLGGNRFLLAENSTSIGRIDEVTVTGDVAAIRVIKNDPGVTAMTLIGKTVWIDNAKFDYRKGKPLQDKDPGTFVIYAAPLH